MNNIKLIPIGIFISLLGISCTSDDDAVTPLLDVVAVFEDSPISRFDTNTTLNIRFESVLEGQKVESAAVFDTLQKLGDVTLNGNTGTFNTSILPPFEFGKEKKKTGTFDTRVTYQSTRGNTTTIRIPIEVVNPLTITKEVASTPYKSNDPENFIVFETFTKEAPIDAVTAQWSINSEEEYQDTGLVFSVNKDSINLNDREYITYGLQPGDTLHYRLTITSGTRSEDVETSIVLTRPKFNSANEDMQISNDLTTNGYNLATASNVNRATEEGQAEIVFEAPQSIRATADTSIEFVRVALPNGSTVRSYFEDSDVLREMEIFERGAKTSAIVNARQDDLYVYRIIRGEGNEAQTYFGLIRIGNVTVVNNELTTISFTYQEAEEVK